MWKDFTAFIQQIFTEYINNLGAREMRQSASLPKRLIQVTNDYNKNKTNAAQMPQNGSQKTLYTSIDEKEFI